MGHGMVDRSSINLDSSYTGGDQECTRRNASMNGDPCTPVLCADIGGTSTKVGVFERPDRLRLLESIPTRGPAEEFGRVLCEALRRAKESLRQEHSEISGLGVAVAGFLNDDRDRMIYNSNLPWLEDYPLRALLVNELDMPVEIEVDSNAAALAEFHLGIGRASSRFLSIAVGTGLGVGMIIDGQPLRFAYGCLGDAGHIVVQPNGPLCTCGGRGCAELFVSAPALAAEYRLRTNRDEPCSLRDLIHAARDGDVTACSILEHAGEWLGVATASLANMFYPDHVAFAGGLAEAGDLVLHSIQRSFDYSASKFARERVVLSRATLGSMATLTGAAYPILAHLHESASIANCHEDSKLLGRT
jgi:glucokinase